MVISTKAFTLTSSAYQDVSEGARECWFEIPFNRNQVNDIRVFCGVDPPLSVTTANFYKASPNRPIGNQDQPESFPMHFQNLVGRVYLRMDTNVTLTLTVFRQ